MAGRPHISALAIAVLLTASPARALEVVGSGKARFAWAEASGPVAAYLVYVSRNGAPFPPFPEQAVRTASAEVPGQVGNSVVVAVAALTANGLPGPLSEPSHPVRFVAVPSPPAISVAPSLVFFSAMPGTETPPVVVEVVNSGGGRLDFEITPSTPWLTASPPSGTSLTSGIPVSLHMDSSSLSPGVHFAALSIRAVGVATPAVVGVVLSVLAPVPQFAVSESSLSIPALLGEGPLETPLTISASVANAGYTVVSDQPWLSTGLAGDAAISGNRTLRIQADPSGLARGTHSAHLYLVPEDSRATPATVDVTLTVVDPSAPPRPVPDLNGDRRADLLFRDRATGSVAIWLMNGAQRLASATLASPVPATEWTLAAVADLDGDGRAEILWQHRRLGAVLAWFMDGTALTRMSLVPSFRELGWELVAADDFDGDRQTDLLWLHPATGTIRVMRLAGTASVGLFDPGPVGETVLSILGVGDFDATGTADVVWRTTDGGIRLWLSSPAGAGQVLPLEAPAEMGWEIAGVGDQDGDGKADLVWRNEALRESQLWRFESPTVIERGALLDLRRLGWTILSTQDFDGDGRTDLLWRSASTGQASIWLMRGFSLRYGVGLAGAPAAAWEVQP